MIRTERSKVPGRNRWLHRIGAYASTLLFTAAVSAQCISGTPYEGAAVAGPGGNVNLTTCNFGGEYSPATGLVATNTYTITGTGGAGNYLTITNTSNGVLQHGPSPQVLTSYTGDIRVHVHVNAACGTDASCHTLNVATAGAPPPPCGSGTCSYTLRLTDSYGDGWSGATMQIRQGTTVVATVGSTFTSGAGPVDVSVPNLCSGTAYNLYWSAGGSFSSEVGVELIDPFGTSLYSKAPGIGSPLTQLYAFNANCTPPACASVTGLSAAPTGSTTANVSWNCASCTGSFIVEYGAPGFTPGTGLTAGAGGTIASTSALSPFSLTGLTGGNSYQVAVRQNCGGTFSINMMAATFQTPPACGNDFYDSGGPSGGYANNENRTITICPDVPGDVVTITFNLVDIESCCDILRVYDANTATGPSTQVATGTTPVITALNPSGCLTVTFTSDFSATYEGWDADITCTPAPTCPPPTSLAATTVTPNSATANWTDNGGGGSFIVEYGPAATFTTPGTDANPGAGGTVITNAVSPQLIGGLLPSTQYRYFVRQDCGAGDYSSNSSAQLFTTLAEPPNCATATVLTCGTPETFTLAPGTGAWGSSFCGWTVAGNERVFQFFAPVAGTYELQVTATNSAYVDYGWKSATGVCDNTGWTCIDDFYSPVTVTFNLPAAGTYWLLADQEGTSGATQTFQINCPCFPGAATATVVDDCGNSQYSIDVDITDLGSGASAGVRYSVNGGANVDATGLGLGVTTVGPFAQTDVVVVTLLSGDEATCDVLLGDYTSNCPIDITCGSTTTVNYCYKNNDSKTWTFNSPTAGETVTLTFVSGTIDEAGDVVRIYDGVDNTGTLLVSSTVNSLVGLTATSTGQSIYMEVDSDPSNSCQDGGQSSWTFEVECTPGCVDPDGSVTVTTDCGSYSFSIDVEVLFTGDGGSTDLSYSVNGGAPTIVPGLLDFDIANIGPFTVGDDVQLFLNHPFDPACNRNLGTFTDNGTCPPLSENCLGAQNLATLTSPFSSTTVGWLDDISSYPGGCQSNTSPDRVFYIDVPNGFTLTIGQTVNGYDSENYMGYGGSCPGNTTIACYDDPDTQTNVWTNTTGSTQRVYWVQDGYSSAANAGTFTLAWNLTAPCTGIPTPGATLSTSTTVCAQANFTLSLETVSSLPGISYQWFVSTTSDSGPWTPISGATSATLVRNQTVQSWYYCEVTCISEPTPGNSTPIQIDMLNDPIACLCTPTYTYGKTDGDLISNVVIVGTTLSNNTGTDPVNPAYTFFNTLPNHTGTLVAGTSYPIQVTVGTYGGQNVAVWIDLNENGVFETPSERVGFTTTSIASGGTSTFTLSLPCDPTPGVKRMRVRDVWNTPGSSIDPCLNYGFGETEDYNVTIDPPPPCPAPSGLAASGVTVTAATLNWTAGCTETAWVVEWGVNGFTLGSGTTVNTVATTTNLSGLTGATTYQAYVRADCDANGLSSWFGPISFTTQTPPPANDLCANAIAIGCNSVTTGSTIAATTTGAPAETCGTNLNTAGGVWYTLEGWDGPMTASLCGSGYDTKIGVFTGSCGALVCVTGNDDFCGPQSEVSWTGVSGTTYYIYVTGFSAGTGAFTLTTECGSNNSACTENGLTLEFQTDALPFETTWEIRNSAGTVVATSGGPLVAPFGVQTESGCVPDGCYTLRVLDAGGDGMTTGGYILRTQGSNQRIIDNRNNFNTGSVSAISGGQGFCLPISNQGLVYTSCDKLDWINGQFVVASPNPAVSAEWVVGGANNVQDNNSGYEFWIFDPNGSYSFRRFRSHNVSDGFGPASATRACHMKLNNWGASTQVPANVLMNVRVRARVNGVNGEFGPACRLEINPVLAACPLTNLMDIPGNQYFSCGVFRQWGIGNFVHARPVAGANRYRFRFRLPAEGYEVIRQTTSYFVQLNWNAAAGAPLEAGKTYDVDVRVSKDGGLTWCTDSDPWGTVCQVTIGNAPANAMASQIGNGAAAEVRMFPNPNRGDVLTFSLSAVEEGVNTVTMDVYDLSGKRVITRQIAVAGGNVNTNVDLNGELAAGMYTVNIIAGTKTYNERLVIQP
ncbi:MAG: GEVED domain-containing protein [Flavobacteriales bacterium]